MANNYTQIKALVDAGNKMGLSNTITRDYGMPLDISEIYNSLEAAKKYAGESPVAYQGQIIAVITETDAQAYIITPTAQADGSYLRPIADLTEIVEQLEELDEKIDEHQEVQLAHELGDSEDSSYSIKVDSSDNLCLIKNNTNGTTNSLVIGSDTIKAQHSKTVEEDPVIFPVGQLNTLPVNDTDKFKNIEELDTDMLPEENRGAKVQQLFKEKQLTTGGIFYDCPTFKQNDSKFGIKFVIDDDGNGHVDLDYSVNSMFDITYDPETMKIIRFGDFYFYVVYDATNKPIGALCIGRPEGVFAYGNANYSASWRYFSTNTQKQSVPFYTSTTAYTDGTPSGTFNLNNANLDNKYGVDEYGRQWIPRINDLEKNDSYAMSPLPVVQFAKQQTNNGPAANSGKGVTLKALTNDNQFAPVYGWGSPTVIYQLFSYDRTLEINETETKTETRYYIILASNNGKVTTTPITNYQFTLNNTTYEISKDCTKIILSGQNLITSSILESFDLLKIFNGKGPLLSAKDEYALPSNSKNLWGSYWLAGPDRDKYDIRVGIFDPDETSYEYKVDANGTKSAERLNPAGNYSIGKLESFHPLRINMTGDPKVDELYIRTATIKGFKTTMDWPNASAVAPRDCSLRSGTVWVQFIWAYPVKEDKPRLFFRVLFDGYVNTAEYKDLTGTYRYPWSPCYELTNIGAIEEAKKYTDQEINKLDQKLTGLLDPVSAVYPLTAVEIDNLIGNVFLTFDVSEESPFADSLVSGYYKMLIKAVPSVGAQDMFGNTYFELPSTYLHLSELSDYTVYQLKVNLLPIEGSGANSVFNHTDFYYMDLTIPENGIGQWKLFIYRFADDGTKVPIGQGLIEGKNRIYIKHDPIKDSELAQCLAELSL